MKKIIALLFCFASGFAYGQAATVFNKLQAGSLTIPSCTGIMTAAGASPVTCSSTIPLATGISGFGSGVAAALSMGLNTPSGITSGMIVANSIDLTGATDASSALQAIINNNPTKTIYIPAGTVQLANPITVNGGQVLRCEGRTQTIFFIPASFPLNAVGEITLGNGGNGAQIIDCGITFSQPSPLTRANIIKYPPAIYVKDLPRATIDRVRVSNGWECLDGRGNAGGTRIGIFECGGIADSTAALGAAIAFDGSLDFNHFASVEIWPFGFDSSGTTVWEDQSTIGLSIGREDGLAIDKLATFDAKTIVTANANNGTPISFNTYQADGDGSQLAVSGGAVHIGNMYATNDGGTLLQNGAAINVSGGATIISNADFNFSNFQGPDVYVTGGSLTINGGNLYTSAIAQPLMIVNGGIGAVRNVNASYAGTRTNPFFYQSSGSMILQNNWAASQLASTSSFVLYTSDNPTNYYGGNNFISWPEIFNFNTAIGYYKSNYAFPLTLTPGFTTLGDFSSTITSQISEYVRDGNFVKMYSDITFNTNAYTTASGAFYLTGVNIYPIVRGGNSSGACVLENASNITSATPFFPEVQSNFVFFRTFISGGNASTLGNGNITPAKTGVEIRMSCSYRVR